MTVADGDWVASTRGEKTASLAHHVQAQDTN